ncbi:MAG: GNAT family N-acetyltransferase [Anaerolineae bacterium]|nr:GNAT family N-acetyltransferase [Anaerolineae bacterium]
MDFKPLFTGRLVRLAAPQPDDHLHFAKWSENDEYLRVMDNDPARPQSAQAHQLWEQSFSGASNLFFFRLRTLSDDTLIGLAALGDVHLTNHTASLGIAISDPAYWSKGYGTDAMRLIVGYGFRELNLHRITSSTISYNVRSIKVHEKVGFKHEGIQRESIQREGQRYDVIHFGILRSEWEALSRLD